MADRRWPIPFGNLTLSKVIYLSYILQFHKVESHEEAGVHYTVRIQDFKDGKKNIVLIVFCKNYLRASCKTYHTVRMLQQL